MRSDVVSGPTSAVGDPPVNGAVSFWHEALGGRPDARAALTDAPLRADVAIVGGGFTGLWCAYYLKQAQPDLDVVVLEKEFAGFGASGRNGGWMSAKLAGSRQRYAKTHGRSAVTRMERLMIEAVDEIIGVTCAEGIDADIVKSGLMHVATNRAQFARLQEGVAADREWGKGEKDVRLLDAKETAERMRIPNAVGSMFSPHAARIHPAKLVRGLAEVVERLGVRIFENTPVTEILPRTAVTTRGVVHADVVLRCTEGFTASIKGQRRVWLPMNSAMVITEPLDAAAWSTIGWSGHELLGDVAHGYTYAQHTADGRVAIGGRGVPYRFGSRTDQDGRTQPRTVQQLVQALRKHFPAVPARAIEHTWCGVLGVPRDWCTTVGYDQATGVGYAGGYVGHGVTTTNLAARTLVDLALGRDTELTRLPWVGRQVRRWEPEPLRWAGVHAVYGLYHLADRLEDRGSAGTALPARIADRITGRH
ncbi:MAG: FAD-dependent oxidoreductase [Streptosporangiales bacterium]|nr:FAD-dependent oxidoreductase [Streptosporangiales bacterium]